jgi:hypothetical protein
MIAFLDEGASSPRLMEVSEALAIAVARATYVNMNRESFSISFNSLFIVLGHLQQ